MESIRKKNRIAFLFVPLVCAAVFLCAACAYTPAQQYVDFVVDLNILERFTDCFTKAEQNSANLYTTGELETMAEDLSSWDMDYEPAKRANYYFGDSIHALLDSIDYTDRGMDMDAQLAYDKALEYYREGEMQLYRISVGDTDA